MLLLVVIFLLGILVPYSFSTGTHGTTSEKLSDIGTSDRTAHIPIDLGSDADLDAFIGKTGNGTPSNPYIISNLSIQANGGMFCIRLRSIHKNLIISDCLLSGATGNNTGKAIDMDSCQNITIIGCIIDSCNIGISLEFSTNVDITSNQISNVAMCIAFYHSNNCDVVKNTCDVSEAYYYSWSIWATASNYLTIDNNTILGGHNGIAADAGFRVRATNNTISDVQSYCIYFAVMTNSSIIGNRVLNGYYGFYMHTLVNSTVMDNFCNKSSYGFNAIKFNNSIFANNTAEANKHGIGVSHCINTSISDNIVKDSSEFGMVIYDSRNNTFSRNQMTGCGVDLRNSFYNSIDSSNTVNLKELLVFERVSNLTLSGFLAPGQVICINCTNTSIVGLDVSQAGHGILLSDCTNMSVINCSFSGNRDSGIHIESTSECIIINTNCTGNGQNGIELESSHHITITGCDISNSEYGIDMYSSSGDLIKSNTIHNNKYNGIMLVHAYSNHIESNTIYQNINGLGIFYSSHNVIEYNNISYNTIGIFARGDEGYGNNTIAYNVFTHISELCIIANEDVNNVHDNTCITPPADTAFPIAVGMAFMFLSVAVVLFLYAIISKRSKLAIILREKRLDRSNIKEGKDKEIFNMSTLYKVLPASAALAIAGMFVLPLSFIAGGLWISYGDCSGSFSLIYVLWSWGFYNSRTGWNDIDYVASVCYNVEDVTDSHVSEAFGNLQIFTFVNLAVILALVAVLLVQALKKRPRFIHSSLAVFNSYSLVTGLVLCIISLIYSYYPSPYGLLLVGLAAIGITVQRSLYPDAQKIRRDIKDHALEIARSKYAGTSPRCTSCNEPMTVEDFVAHKGLCDMCLLRKKIKLLKFNIAVGIFCIPTIMILSISTLDPEIIFQNAVFSLVLFSLSIGSRVDLKKADAQYRAKMKAKQG
jgi:parallel beta-helix repeat protein